MIVGESVLYICPEYRPPYIFVNSKFTKVLDNCWNQNDWDPHSHGIALEWNNTKMQTKTQFWALFGSTAVIHHSILQVIRIQKIAAEDWSNGGKKSCLDVCTPMHFPIFSCSTGVYVEEMFDSNTEKLYTGLLGIGDEILEVNQEKVAGLSLDLVTQLMTKDNIASVRVLRHRKAPPH